MAMDLMNKLFSPPPQRRRGTIRMLFFTTVCPSVCLSVRPSPPEILIAENSFWVAMIAGGAPSPGLDVHSDPTFVAIKFSKLKVGII